MINSNLEDIYKQIIVPIFFVTPDITWALGVEEYLPNYHIICLDDHPLIDLVSKKTSVFCLKREHPDLEIGKNTGQMLNHPLVQEYISKQSRGEQPAVMYFKPQSQIDKICHKFNYLPIGNAAILNRKFDDQINLVELSQRHPELQIVPSYSSRLQDLKFGKLNNQILDPSYQTYTSYVLQFSRGWAGRTTFLVDNESDLKHLQSIYGNIRVKLSPLLDGATYLNNACVVNNHILQSQPAIQINSPHPEFGSSKFTTCGRQWPGEPLTPGQLNNIQQITEKIGQLMAEDRYKGYFGLDFLIEEFSGKVFLLEINPRLTASSSFYTQLEINLSAIPLLYYHLFSFLKPDHELLNKEYKPPIIKGTQLVVRNTTSETVTIQNPVKTGIYTLDGHEFNFKKETYKVSNIKTPDEYLLISPSQGTEISPESEILRCESSSPVLDKNHQLPQDLMNSLLSIKHQILV